MQGFLQTLKYIVALLIIALIGLSIPNFLSFNSKKESIEQNLKKIVDYDFRIDGDVKISLLPLPKITLNNVTASDKNGGGIQVNKIVVNPTITSVFSNDVKITKVVIYDAELNVTDIKNTKNAAKTDDTLLKIPNLELVNTTIIFDSELREDIKIKNINAKFVFDGGDTKNLKLNSNFAFGSTKYNFDASFKNINMAGDSDDAIFSLYNDLFSLDFQGKLDELFTSPQLDGKAGFSIKSFSTNGKADQFLQKLTNDNFKSSADVLITKSLISISKFKVESNSIKNGTGELEWLFGFEQEIDGSINIDSINLDTMFPKSDEKTTSEVSAISVIEEIIRPLINEFDIEVRNRIFGGISLAIKEIIYKEQKVENLKLGFDLYNGDFALDHFKFTAPGQTSYLMQGNMSFNDVRPRFEGSSALQIKDIIGFAKWLNIPLSEKLQKEKPELSFTTKLDIIPRSLRLQSIKLSLGNTNMIGKASFKDTGEKRLNTKLTLRINEINTNDFELSTKVDDIITQMFLFDNDKFGGKFTEYVNDYRWLRTFPLNLNAELLIDKAIYKDKTFSGVHNSFKISPNNLTFDKFSIYDDLINIDGRMGISLTAIKPNIFIDLSTQKLDWNSIAGLFPSYNSLYKLFVSQTMKASQAPTDPNAAPQSYNAFNFYSLNNFNCDFKINFQQIVNSNLPITAIVAQGKLNEGVIDFQDLVLNIFNGQMEAKGSVAIINSLPNLSISYAINNFNPQSALWYFFDYNNFKGYMSANGTISSTGYSIPTLLYNMTGNLNFVGKKVIFSGMDLSQIIKVTESGDALNLRMEALRSNSVQGETVFDEVAGNLTFDKGLATLVNMSLATNRSRGFYSTQFDYINHLVNGKGKISFIPAGTVSAINIDIENKGKMVEQVFAVNTESVAKFLQSKLAATEAAKTQEDKAQSLLRNRKL